MQTKVSEPTEVMTQPCRQSRAQKALPGARLVPVGVRTRNIYRTPSVHLALGSNQEHKAFPGLVQKRRHTHRKPRTRQDRMHSQTVVSFYVHLFLFLSFHLSVCYCLQVIELFHLFNSSVNQSFVGLFPSSVNVYHFKNIFFIFKYLV